MKTTLLLLPLLLFPALAATTSSVQEPERSVSMQEAMLKSMALMAPGPEHAELARWAGDFEVSTKFWMPGVEQAMTSTGKSHHEMVLGGRFLKMDTTGSMMGTPTETLTMLGFDRRHEHYTTVSFDTMGTYFVTAAGAYDEAAKKLTMYGEDEDPAMGVTQKYDFVMTFVDDDTFTMELIFKPGTFGNEEDLKVVEATYTRVKE